MSLNVRHSASPLPSGTAACLGAFDGLHLGHRALLERARLRGSQVAVVTFDPHPQRVLAPDRPLHLLLQPGQRERVLRSLGVEELVLLPFDHAMAAMEPAVFVRSQIVDGLRPSIVVVGEDFRFGAGRRGGVDELAALLADPGIGLEVVAPVSIPPALREPGTAQRPEKISSTMIRAALASGRVERAAAMLGRLHTVIGTVVTGDRRGRTIGIPTANLRVGDALVPAPGVYATWVTAGGEPELATPRAAVANIGTVPTFTAGTGPPRVEVHVLDVDLGERLYDRELEVSFVARLRDEQKFASIEALVQRIALDIAQARPLLDASSRARVIPP
ncbi:MAG TPA: riboflavin biosynthesis protein RibF [Nannocystaceae bacterium]|nr:riboflavin biosynthesis protein RibF [Nannocystaceae bacterium]